MSEVAGRTNQVFALAGTTAMTGATGAKINGIDNSTWNQLCELLEISQFGDTYKNRMAGLLDTEVQISGNYDPVDTNGQAIMIAGNYVMIGIYPQGTTVVGRQVRAIVESVEIAAEPTGKQAFTASLKGCAAPVALPLRP